MTDTLNPCKEDVERMYKRNRHLVDVVAQFVRAQVEFGSDFGLEGMIALAIESAGEGKSND